MFRLRRHGELTGPRTDPGPRNSRDYTPCEALAWPSEGGAAAFDAAFSTADPNGATKPVTEFKGHLFDRDGSPLPSGTVVEAYVGDVRCGLTSLRAGAQLSFRLDGREASQTAVNNLRGDAGGSEIDLTVK